MPARKTTKKAPGKAASRTHVSSGQMIPYGPAIRDAVARGDIQEMRKVAVAARKWIKDVQTALAALERSIQRLGARG
ncbi:MAG: DUF1843 domain-containing protein [Acidobacteriota bacterium]|nr:DUF1843 domain-containing protein [Acidobacteriota bacterium]